MNSFVNREVENINRKRLNVVNLEYDGSGEISSLVVDVIREDGYVEGNPVGTRLDAESMKAAVESLVYKNIFGLNVNPNSNDFLTITENKNIQISHCNGIPLYPKYLNYGGTRYDLQCSYNSSNKYTSITFDFNPNWTTDYSEIVNVVLYLDSAFTLPYCVLPFKIVFTASSNSSGD